MSSTPIGHEWEVALGLWGLRNRFEAHWTGTDTVNMSREFSASFRYVDPVVIMKRPAGQIALRCLLFARLVLSAMLKVVACEKLQ